MSPKSHHANLKSNLIKGSSKLANKQIDQYSTKEFTGNNFTQSDANLKQNLNLSNYQSKRFFKRRP